MDWIKEIAEYKDHDKVFSFEEYMEKLNEDPKTFCRPSSIYFKDMFQHYGKSRFNTYNLFLKESYNSPSVQGQEKVQSEIYEKISNFVDEGFNNKFILLIGPNGSSKSSIVKKIMHAAQEYSKTQDGQLFTFSWVFPVDNFVKGSLGFKQETAPRKLDTYAYLEDREINAVLGSDLKDHPLLLIPLEKRQKILTELFKDQPDLLDSLEKSYLFNSDLSKRNKLIFEELLKTYQGDYLQVYKHIRIERFTIDRKFSSSAVTIEPQMHVDAQLQQITMDKRIGALPASLQSLNLVALSGPIVMANRGVLEFSDLLKRPLDAFKYLLTTMESRAINLGGIVSELDVFFIGTTNEVHFNAFKQHPDFNSFRGRFNFIRVPYLLNYQQEKMIYKDQLYNMKDRSHFERHALEVISLWSVMTRLRKPTSQELKDKKLAELINKLSSLEKALFIADKTPPEYLSSKEKQLLISAHKEVCEEYETDVMYEGKFGISPREIKQVIYDLGSDNKVVTYIEVIQYLRELSEKKSEFDFLNIAPQDSYHNSLVFLNALEEHILSVFDSELRKSLGLVDERSYESYIEKYVHQVKAYIKKEKVRNSVTNKYEECDMYFVQEFEKNISIKESVDDFRSHIISRLGAYTIDHPGKELVMSDIYPSIVKSLKESFRKEQKIVIKKIEESLVYYDADNESISQADKVQIDAILENLNNEFGYTKEGAIRSLKHLLQKKY